jgi:hypothetical protein
LAQPYFSRKKDPGILLLSIFRASASKISFFISISSEQQQYFFHRPNFGRIFLDLPGKSVGNSNGKKKAGQAQINDDAQ